MAVPNPNMFGGSIFIDQSLMAQSSTAQVNMQQQMQQRLADDLSRKIAESVKFDIRQDPSRYGYEMRATAGVPDNVTTNGRNPVSYYRDRVTTNPFYEEEERPKKPKPKTFLGQLEEEVNGWLAGALN